MQKITCRGNKPLVLFQIIGYTSLVDLRHASLMKNITAAPTAVFSYSGFNKPLLLLFEYVFC